MDSADLDQYLKEFGFPTAAGGFGTVLADPPWSFSDKGSRAAPDWEKHKLYETMRAEDILALPIDLLAAPRAHLYLWTTDTHLPLALNCVSAWGFVFKKALVWVKRRVLIGNCRGPLQIGMGHYFRSAKEVVLFATRGRAPAMVHNLPDVFEAARTQHSRKPESLHEWAEKLSPSPRLELFSRRSRDGWEGWGDQYPGPDAYRRLLDALGSKRAGVRAKRTEAAERRRASVDLSKMQQGLAKWPARCAVCRCLIAAGDAHFYSVETSARACSSCAVSLEQAREVVPF